MTDTAKEAGTREKLVRYEFYRRDNKLVPNENGSWVLYADVAALAHLQAQEIDWDAVLADAIKPTPKQAAYIDASNRGENIGAIITPLQWFEVGAKAAVAKIRGTLIAEQREVKP